MARLRAGFGLTQQEVSERLHIRTRYINAIEEGRYELMPGKIYARGYIHSYAEFLGMEADNIVARCFAKPIPTNMTVASTLQQAANRQALALSQLRSYAVSGVVLLAVVLLVIQLAGGGASGEAEEPTVASVPEEMLSSVRTLVMPTSSNGDCLMADRRLGCFYANATMRLIAHDNAGGRLIGAGDVDVSEYIVEPPKDSAAEDMPVSHADEAGEVGEAGEVESTGDGSTDE